MTCSSPATSATLLVVLALQSASSQPATSRCSGTVDPCSGRQNLTVYEGKALNLQCPPSTNSSAVQWFVNGTNVNFTESSTVLFFFNKSIDKFFFTIQKRNGSSSSITVYPRDPGEYEFSCAPDELISSTYTVCVLHNAPTKLFDHLSTFDSDLIYYASPGTAVTLNCSYHYGKIETAFNYSIAWFAGHGRSQERKYSSCSFAHIAVNGEDFLFVGSTLDVNKSFDSQDEFVCVMTKVDFSRSQVFDNLTRRFSVRLPPSSLLTSAEIGGISYVSAFAVAIIIYASWRLSMPIRSFVHHVFNVTHHPRAGAMTYDAFVSFNESGQSAVCVSCADLIKKLEGDWHYRLCAAERDFVLGDDMAECLTRVIDQSQKCIFIIDGTFFDNRWCQTALQYALKSHNKIICLLATDKKETKACRDRIKPVAKVGVVINWRTEELKKTWFKRFFVPHYRWTSLKLHLPPNRSLYWSLQWAGKKMKAERTVHESIPVSKHGSL